MEILLMANGAHENVAFAPSHPKSVTLVPPGGGFPVPLPLQKKSGVVDVSETSTLRLDLAVTAMTNRLGFENGDVAGAKLFVTVEHSADQKTWRPLHEFSHQGDLGEQRAVLTGFDNYVRASYYFMRLVTPETTVRDAVAITWSLTGEAA